MNAALNPTSRAPLRTGHGLEDATALWVAGFLILVCTLIRGGNRYVPLILIEWAGLALMVSLAWQELRFGTVSAHLGQGFQRWGLWILASAPIWVAAAQLIPMPENGFFRPLSKHPMETAASALAGIPLMGMFLLGLVASEKTLKRLIALWLGVACFQCLLALLQLGGLKITNFGDEGYTEVIGTFANRNHLAAFIAMNIPLAMLNIKSSNHGDSRKFRTSWVWIAILFLLFASLFATLSRAGLVFGLGTAIVASWVIWHKPLRGKEPGRWLWGLVPALGVLLLAIGGFDWLSRFSESALSESARVRQINRDATWLAALDHLPWGSGLGTFSHIFPKYQPSEIFHYVGHAHSEYLQWFMELGVWFFLLGSVALGLIVFRLMDLLKDIHAASTLNQLSIASGMGLMAISLHALVDFPFRIPANAILAVFLLGVFLHRPHSRNAKQNRGNSD